MRDKEDAWNRYRQACNRASDLEGNVRATERIAQDMVDTAVALHVQAQKDVQSAMVAYDALIEEGGQP